MARTSSILALAAAAALLACAMAASPEEQWSAWKTRYGKAYASEAEETARFGVFKDNLVRIAELNSRGDGAYYSANQFADLSAAEFDGNYKGYVPSAERVREDAAVFEPTDEQIAAAKGKTVDWRTKGHYVTPVKNQQQCGSCWAFSVTEEVESIFAIAGNGLKELSPQQIVSCDGSDDGCNGGDSVSAYKYIMSAGGLESSKAYPYTSGGGDSGQCHFKHNKITANITGWGYATKPSKKSETQMQAAIDNIGPLSICVDASSWQFYSGGVIKSGCGQQLDHCVQTTGYHVSGSALNDDATNDANNDAPSDDDSVSGDYWIVRNSWGESWGYSGYLYVEIGKNLCGIADEATYVTCK